MLCCRCNGRVCEDEEGLYCLPCGARLEVQDGMIHVFSRPHVEPDEDILAEVITAAVEGGSYVAARAVLRRKRNHGGE